MIKSGTRARDVVHDEANNTGRPHGGPPMVDDQDECITGKQGQQDIRPAPADDVAFSDARRIGLIADEVERIQRDVLALRTYLRGSPVRRRHGSKSRSDPR